MVRKLLKVRDTNGGSLQTRDYFPNWMIQEKGLHQQDSGAFFGFGYGVHIV